MVITALEKQGKNWRPVKRNLTWDEAEDFARENIGQAVVIKVELTSGKTGYFCGQTEIYQQYLQNLKEGMTAFNLQG